MFEPWERPEEKEPLRALPVALAPSLGCRGGSIRALDSAGVVLNFVSQLPDAGEWGRAACSGDVSPHMFIH